MNQQIEFEPEPHVDFIFVGFNPIFLGVLGLVMLAVLAFIVWWAVRRRRRARG
ncbi:MAG: hypothetical protein WEE89_08785 [Gemmatimonadota bacterium]